MQIILGDDAAATTAITERLSAELAKKKKVLWFFSGGSNIGTAVKTMANIGSELTKHLTITTIDERFGPVGHPDSNWKQLFDAGFDPKQATLLPPLQSDETLQEAAARYNQQVTRALAESDISVALLGMGTDGHISGILPGSVAAKPHTEMIIGYDSDPYKRLTTTFAALQKISALYLLAYGEAKKDQLLKLRDQNLQLAVQPAQFLKQLPEVYVYNDQIGETT